MKRRIVTVLVAFAFVVGTIGYVSADEKTKKSSNDLALMLPESDMVLTLDSERFMNQALPQILSANQPMLGKINGHIEMVKNKTGLDLREFKQVAVGVKSVRVSANETDFQPVVLARGTVTADTLVSIAKLASNGKYQTEKVSGRTIYIFSPKEIIEQNKDKIKKDDSMVDGIIEKMANGLSKEVALTAYDSNTVAFGMPSRVRETIDNKPRISTEVLNLLNRKPNSIINVGAKTSAGLSKFLPLDNDELGKDLDSIRQIQGSMDVAEGNTIFSMSAKTEHTEQAESLKSNLEAMQYVFSRLLKGMKGDDKKLYGRTLANMEISRQRDEVLIDLAIPQADIDTILKKK